MCGCFSHALHWGPGLQPRHAPWPGIEPWTPCFAGWHSIHWTTLARAPCSSYVLWLWEYCPEPFMSHENLSFALAQSLCRRQGTLVLFSPPTSSWFHPFSLVLTIAKWRRGRLRMREIFLKIKSRENVSCSWPFAFLLDPTLFAFQRPPEGGISKLNLSVPTIWGLKEKNLYSSH